MFASAHVQTAAHWWCAENSVDPSVRRLIPFLFEALDALFASVLRFPDVWAPDKPMRVQSGARHSMYISLPLPPEALSLLRAAIGLSGDAFCIAKRLTGTGLARAQIPMSTLLVELERLRELRNFFSHLDERLANLDKHEITGSAHTNCGIEYSGATGCFHLVLLGNALHFVSEGAALEVDVGKASFLQLLSLARPTFAELTSHNIHRQNSHYPEPQRIYAT